MYMDRFVVFQLEEEWLVSYGDRKQISYKTREEAETSAFSAAHDLASRGRSVSVLIIPTGPDLTAEPCAVLSGGAPRIRPS